MISLGRAIWTAFVLALLTSSVWAADRVALVVGNASYTDLPALKNPANDATDVAQKLEKLGFEVIVGLDLDKNAFNSKILEFAQAMDGAETSLFYYAGHGLQIDDANHLVPTEAALNSTTPFDDQTITVDRIVGLMNQFTTTSLVLLDACRDNPLTSDIPLGGSDGAYGRGLARVNADGGSYIAFATAPGNVAFDGEGRNSPFTTALLRHMENPNIDIRLMMADVRQDVFEATNRRQLPWENSSLIGRFYFSQSNQLERLDASNRTEAQAWQAISTSNREEDFSGFLRNFPDGTFASLATLKLRSLEELDARTNEERTEFLLARANNSEEAWSGFIAAYPNGLFADIAAEELEELKDEIARNQLSIEEIHWRTVRNSTAPQDFFTFLLLYPSGAFSDLARQRLKAAEAAEEITQALVGETNDQANKIKLEQEAKRRASELPVQFIQYGLNALGHQLGDISGVMDRDTKMAVRNYQATIDATQTGRLTPQQTVDLILAASALGDASAMTAAGIMTASGTGLQQDDEIARLWLDRAAQRGNGLAMANLGILYRDGRGGARDIDRARSLLTVAVTMGIDGAEPLLRSLAE